MIHRRSAAALLLCAFLLCAIGVAQEEDTPFERTPAPVMSFHGAAWLERPERGEEEKPYEVIEKMQLERGDLVADIGCGTGYFSRKFAKAVGPHGKVFGVEIQPEFIEMLKENCAKEGIENVMPILGDEDDPMLPPGKIDWIFLSDVYHEFQQPKPMLARMRESLAPDGKVALLEYRLLGDTAKHIKIEHRMSVEQVMSEWVPAGFRLVDRLEFLPSQHFFIFEKDPEADKE